MTNKLVETLEQHKDCRASFLKEAIFIAFEAGKKISSCFYNDKCDVQTKANPADLVTETDVAVENLIFSHLRTKFPDHCFIGEESVSDGTQKLSLTDKHTWVVDPIDGTMNFVHKNQNIAVSIGMTVNKQTEVGVVYAPIKNELYIAVRGFGSFLNGKPLSVSKNVTDLSKALIATEIGSRRDESAVTVCDNIKNILLNHQIAGLRCTGSAALNMCNVASGAIDLYYEWGPCCWDVCAGELIVHEAGGITTDCKGNDFDMMSRSYICSCDRTLINEIVPSFTQIPPLAK